jgi:predicted transcriptional regulator
VREETFAAASRDGILGRAVLYSICRCIYKFVDDTCGERLLMHEPGPRHAQDSSPGAGRRAAGALEAEVLGILRAASGPLSPAEVRQQITAGQERELSYSTVVTIVSRLYDKGMLARQRSGRAFTYTAVDEATIAASRMRLALGSGIDHDAVLSRFVSGLSGRDTRLLRTLLADARDAAADSGGPAADPGGPAADPGGPAADPGSQQRERD